MPTSTLPTPPLAEVYDIAVIGGGINGVGIAADAAGRGLSVFLCEKDDLASHTSSASSKLIHGGLRYLEHYEFRLVREALAEREVLLAKAPHIVKQMRFVLPHRPHLRPAWMIRAGLFLYDNLGKREKLEGSKSLKFGADSAAEKRNHQRLRILRLLGRRCAPGGAQCHGRPRKRRPRPHPDPLRQRPSQQGPVAPAPGARRWQPVLDPRQGAGERRRPLGRQVHS